MVTSWGPSHGYAVESEEVEAYPHLSRSLAMENQGDEDPTPWVHWIGDKPPLNRNNTANSCKVLLYIHGK